MISVNHLLVVTNSSFNFLIYLMASKSQNSQNCKYLCSFYVKLKFSVFGRGVANNEILVGQPVNKKNFQVMLYCRNSPAKSDLKNLPEVHLL